MKKAASFTLSIILLLTLVIGAVQAQTRRGSIQGFVYEDVNGDGKCVNTGVDGEGPVEGVDVEFVSSDEKTIITLYSGPEGIYGLFAAGSSYWRVTAKPNADWVVTSENPLYAPLDDDNRAVVDVNFCVRKANAAGSATVILPYTQSATVILPESGASHPNVTGIVAAVGALFVIVGLALEWRRRTI